MAEGKTVNTVKAIVKPAVEALGLRLWDVRFLKEGASWYLRIYIDSDKGIDINDCTEVSHAIDPLIDEADPIDKAYYLEVCSPGLGRELRNEEHFEIMKNKPVVIHTIRALDGLRDVKGNLSEWDKETVVLESGGEKITVPRNNISSVKADDFE